jgi:hypothetical protein
MGSKDAPHGVNHTAMLNNIALIDIIESNVVFCIKEKDIKNLTQR